MLKSTQLQKKGGFNMLFAMILKCLMLVRFDKIARASEWSVPLGDEIVGRYVRIQLEATTFLHFAELEVMRLIGRLYYYVYG